MAVAARSERAVRVCSAGRRSYSQNRQHYLRQEIIDDKNEYTRRNHRPCRGQAHPFRPARGFEPVVAARHRDDAAEYEGFDQTLDKIVGYEDRKSTRLNSSHL